MAHLSLFMSKCCIVGNHMLWLICHTGKGNILQFAGIYVNCLYFIDRMW